MVVDGVDMGCTRIGLVKPEATAAALVERRLVGRDAVLVPDEAAVAALEHGRAGPEWPRTHTARGG